jgi:hypothetical protein
LKQAREVPHLRAYLVALGLATLIVGLPLLFAGYVGVGCTAVGSGGNPSSSNCGGANALELIGGILVVVALIFFAASFVPTNKTSYK